MKEKIVILGGGGHAKVIISILKKIDKYEIVGYTDLENKARSLELNILVMITYCMNCTKRK